MGISKSRNRGIQSAKGKYIAAFDCDDIALTHRLETQVNFMETHPEYGLTTGNLIIIDESSRITGERRYPSSDGDIRKIMLRYNPFAQPAAMFRKDICTEVGYYNETLRFCGDYDLFLRIATASNVCNLNIFLTKYRIHAN